MYDRGDYNSSFLCAVELKMRNRIGPKTDIGRHQIGLGLDLRLDHPIPLFESAQESQELIHL